MCYNHRPNYKQGKFFFLIFIKTKKYFKLKNSAHILDDWKKINNKIKRFVSIYYRHQQNIKLI